MRVFAPVVVWCCGLVPAVLVSPHATAADYPTRPIRMLTGFIAGGGSDIAARSVSVKLSEIFGQSVVVDNRPGATGAIAGEMIAKAQSDGYTMMPTLPVGDCNSPSPASPWACRCRARARSACWG